MNPLIGSVGVWIALAGSLWLAATGLMAARTSSTANMRGPVLTVLIGSIVSMIALQSGLLADDFSMEYVANHSATTTPFIYKVASAWGALEGSIVLWGLVLALAIWWSWRTRRSDHDKLDAIALGVMGVVAVFFFGLMATVANPFEVCTNAASIGCAESTWWPFADSSAALQGRGPNPLLQNHPLVAAHPPTLYLGYVGLTAPFAYAMSALIVGKPGIEWVLRTRKLTLLAWGFLTLGILFGGWWSYEVLGWGGYWAWDPVENASLLPWLTATAFLHSSVVQVRRGSLQTWNFVLVIITFSFTILGTFLTRSGVITSVHSFTQSLVAPLLLGFFVLVIVFGLGLFAVRSHLLETKGKVTDPVSREGGLMMNNVLLSAWATTVLIGTVYPILIEAFADRTVGIGRGFFDTTTLPLAFVLLLIMGVGETAPWKSASWDTLIEKVRVPAIVALGVGAAMVAFGIRSPSPLIAITLAVFISVPPLREMTRQVRARVARGAKPHEAFSRIASRDRAYWGGMLSHLGVALVVIGVAGSAGLGTTVRALELPRGVPVPFADYTLVYDAGFTYEEPQRSVVGARVEVLKGDSAVASMRPTINDYGTQAVPTPAVDSTITRDIYLSLRRVDANTATVDALVFPLQWLVWFGGIVVAAGGFWALTSRRASRSSDRPATRV